jgi:tubulin-specific chaperone C
MTSEEPSRYVFWSSPRTRCALFNIGAFLVQQVQELEKMLERLRVSSTPKSKFAFKRKEKATTDNTSVATSPPPATPPSVDTQEGTTGNFALSSQSHTYLTFESLPSIQHSSPSSTLTISKLDACVVNLLPSPRPPSDSLNDNHPELIRLSAIHVHNLSNTVLLLPFIEGSMLLHDLARCIVVIGCHQVSLGQKKLWVVLVDWQGRVCCQFRMHNSDKVDVYLSIPSHPIIEHCTRIRFTGYPAAWSSQAESQVQSSHQAVWRPI